MDVALMCALLEGVRSAMSEAAANRELNPPRAPARGAHVPVALDGATGYPSSPARTGAGHTARGWLACPRASQRNTSNPLAITAPAT